MAYHHVPYMAYGVFAKSLASKYIDEDTVIPSLLNPRNPAGIIYNNYDNKIIIINFIDMMMDMLGNPEVRSIITEKYQKSKEQIGIRNANTQSRARLV